jgi:hypothetical protein
VLACIPRGIDLKCIAPRSRHENLVRLFGWYVSAEGGRVCLVMELLPDTLARCGNQARLCALTRVAFA